MNDPLVMRATGGNGPQYITGALAGPRVLTCSECGLPWGRVENGVLIVESRHHGQTHSNVMALSALLEMSTPECVVPVQDGAHGDNSSPSNR